MTPVRVPFLCRCFALLLSVSALTAWALSAATPASGLQVIPVLSSHVMDTTGTLGGADRQALDAKLTAFEQQRGAQLVVLMVVSTQPEDITVFAQRVGDAWKIGRQNIGDGLLIVVAKNDRTARVATTKALEGAIPDLVASQIIATAMTPRFKQGDFAGGLNAAADQLMARISGEALPAPTPKATAPTGGTRWADMAIFLLFAVPVAGQLLARVLGRKLGALATGAGVGVLAWLFTSSVLIGAVAAGAGLVFALISGLGAFSRIGSGGLGSLGGGGFGGGGGGFSSGGGGNFGGGGASGNW